MMTRREACLLFGGATALVGTAGGWARATALPRNVTDGFERAAPHTVDVDADAVIAFLDDARAKGLELDSFMLWRKGKVAAEGWWWPYRPPLVHMLHSATKSFVSAGVGIAISEGLIALDDPVLKFFPGRVAKPSANLEAMTVESLLTQTSGHAIGISGSQWRPIKTSWVDEFLKVPVVYTPGTHFAYSSATSYMLSAIITQRTGTTLHEYLRPRLFEPAQMHGVTWDVGPENINPGGNGLSVTTADFLKLGVLHLTQGRWKGRQVIPAEWTRSVGVPRHGNPYGYQWWAAPDGQGFFAAGKFGQFCFVSPKLDAVLTVTSGVADNEATRNIMHALGFGHLAKMCGQAEPKSGAELALRSRIEQLRVLPPLVPATSPMARQVSGATYACAPNADQIASIGVVFDKDICRFTLSDPRGDHLVEAGLADWRESETTVTGSYLHHEYQPESMRVVAGGRWTSPNQFEMNWQFIESGFRDTVALTFEGDTVRYDRGVNINSGPLRRPTIMGKHQS
ncbi:hypothetical protein BH10PSE3_BH10PSE3_19670 [soil metagenome]